MLYAFKDAMLMGLILKRLNAQLQRTDQYGDAFLLFHVLIMS